MRRRLSILLCVVGGCWRVTVPDHAAGPIPLTLINDTSYRMCELTLTGIDGVHTGNWITRYSLPAHKRVTLKVKADSYAVHVHGCDDTFDGGMAIAALRPVTLHVGETAGPSGPDSAWLTVKTMQVMPASAAPAGGGAPAGGPAQQCVPDGQPVINGSDSFCCSHASGSNVDGAIVCCANPDDHGYCYKH